MVGGFLGAGKTTTLARLGRHYAQQGLRVGLVTNDQASDLVDTATLRSQGFNVGEVAGSCFCCNFDGLMGTIERLGSAMRPDLILAEPVGSCTDLVATVVQPLKQLFDAQFSIAPYCVILKPSHGGKILRNDANAGFSPKAAYILRKQLEEADAVLINRVDELSRCDVDELARLVDQHYAGRPVLRVSARDGTGFEALFQLLDQQGDFGRRILDVDYDLYAEGEAELGWLNASIRVRAPSEVSIDRLLLAIIARLQESLDACGAETAHLKAIGLWEGFYGVANLVSRAGRPELSLASNCQAREFDLIVNARVAAPPEQLEALVREAVARGAASHGAAAEFRQTQSFRPGRPVPTHRVSVPVGA
jgi:Ni2+-binding GTPase involved in maturation of urease and hydrogenase